MIYTIFKRRGLNKKRRWVSEFVIYHGYLSHINPKSDWRLKAIKGLRDELVYVGLSIYSNFDKGKIQLLNGDTINVNQNKIIKCNRKIRIKSNRNFRNYIQGLN